MLNEHQLPKVTQVSRTNQVIILSMVNVPVSQTEHQLLVLVESHQQTEGLVHVLECEVVLGVANHHTIRIGLVNVREHLLDVCNEEGHRCAFCVTSQ